MTQHTILLIQKTQAINSRLYTEHPSVGEAMDSILKHYETKLKALNPHMAKISYEVKDLQSFLDKYHDICALVFNPKISAYVPKDRQWIKDELYRHLLSGAAGSSK